MVKFSGALPGSFWDFLCCPLLPCRALPSLPLLQLQQLSLLLPLKRWGQATLMKWGVYFEKGPSSCVKLIVEGTLDC